MAAKKKQMQKQCMIKQWVEMKDPEFAKVFDDLCMANSLLGRASGATFLYPTGAVRKHIMNLTYSDAPEEAVEHLNAHIIQMAVREAADFRKGDIGTRLGLLLEVDSVHGEHVVLKGGAKIKPASDFKPLMRDNIAVWEVESGEIPLKGPEFKAPPPRGRRKAVAAGGSPPAAAAHTLNSRALVATTVEKEFDTCMRANRCKTHDPYLAHVVSLLNFLKNNKPEVFLRVLPIVDRDPFVTFYLLIEPYKTHGADFLIEESILFGDGGWNAAQSFGTAVTEFEEIFKNLASEPTRSAEDRSSGENVIPWVFRGDPKYVRSAIDNIRLRIVGEDSQHLDKIHSPKAVHAAYMELIEHNKIDDVQPILPDETIRALPGSKKLWQDDFRFKIHELMKDLRNGPEYTSHAFHEIVNIIRSARGNNYSSELSLANLDTLQKNISPNLEMSVFCRFVNSDAFLYMPVSAEEIVGGWGDVPVTSDPAIYNNPNDLNVYNTEVGKQRLLDRYKATGHDEPRELSQGHISAAISFAKRNNGQLTPRYRIVETPARADNM